MIPALVLAVLAAPNPAAQAVKTLTIDDFTQGVYSFTLGGENSNSHVSYGLARPHSLLDKRSFGFHISNNPNNTTLTLAIGNGEQKFTSPLQLSWHCSSALIASAGPFADLSAVDKFMWDFYTAPGAKLPDLMSILVEDKNGKTGSTGSWRIRGGGVYFRRTDFSNYAVLDWKHIRTIQLQQDFGTLPNPTTYALTRFYATLKPQSLPPSQ